MSSAILNHTKKNGLVELKDKYQKLSEELRETVIEHKKALERLNKSVHKSPWMAIGAVSAFALLAGFIFGKSK